MVMAQDMAIHHGMAQDMAITPITLMAFTDMAEDITPTRMAFTDMVEDMQEIFMDILIIN